MLRLLTLLATLVLGAGLARAAASDYVGADVCGSCHPAQLASWKTSAHARAAAPEVLGKRARAGACLGCHATGEGAAAERLPGVQCEACHGAGAAYATDDLMRDLPLARALGLKDLSTDPAATCGRCHRPDSATRVRPFEYARAWKSIAH